MCLDDKKWNKYVSLKCLKCTVNAKNKSRVLTRQFEEKYFFTLGSF